MTTLDALARWRAEGAISGEQHEALAAIVRKERFSVFLELNAILYVGVLAFVAGLGWTVYEHFAQLGDMAIVVPLALMFVGSLYYCFAHAEPFAAEKVDSPGFAFDYVLYLGCLVFGLELGYIEFRFQVLRASWDYYLLGSAMLYFVLAYRFDNRFVLSLALSTLAGWFGVRLTLLGIHLGGSLRGDALAFAALTSCVGWATYRLELKRHFLETYLHLAVNVALGALVSGVFAGEASLIWFLALIATAGVVIQQGAAARRFAFVVYGVVYGYIGLSNEVLRGLHDPALAYLYFIVSGGAVLVALVVMSRRIGREE